MSVGGVAPASSDPAQPGSAEARAGHAATPTGQAARARSALSGLPDAMRALKTKGLIARLRVGPSPSAAGRSPRGDA